MEEFTFHGPISIDDVVRALEGEFGKGSLRVQAHGDGEFIVVQIASVARPASGGRTALTIHLSSIEDGVHIKMGQQEWMGIAASLGRTALGMLRNPAYLLGRLDNLAEDISSLQLNDRVRETIERVAKSVGASFEISEALRRLTCIYCLSAKSCRRTTLRRLWSSNGTFPTGCLSELRLRYPCRDHYLP